jgi:hypothetical protein
MMHNLKTDPEVFQAVWTGDKNYEICFDDRGFKVGDLLQLKETRYSGEEIMIPERGATTGGTGSRPGEEIKRHY